MENTIGLRGISFLGLFFMVGLAWLCSEDRRRANWRLAGWAIALQFVLGFIVLRTGFGEAFFDWVKMGFVVITDASKEGARFLFGNLTEVFILEHVLVPEGDGVAVRESFAVSAVVAFQMLPVIIFVSGLSAILQHLRVIQAVVQAMAWLMRRTLKTSGAETVGAALLVFLGIESVSALGLYLKRMTRSELFTLMVGFLATIASSVMVLYAGFGAEPGHLLAASIMSAPAAIAMAKLLVPETGTPQTAGNARVKLPVESQNIFDAASQGTSLGLNMALNVGAMLIVFVGLIHLLDLVVVKITAHETTELMGWLMRPFAFVMGVPRSDIAAVSELLATKTVFNEFLAYEHMGPLLQENALTPRGAAIATYALCGFANPGSLGILIGALAGMVPERRSEVAQLSVRAFVGGTLACFMTACIAGILT